MMGRSWGI